MSAKNSIAKSVCIVLLAFAIRDVKAEVSKEYEIKAAFLFHFAQFVEWPDSTNNVAPFYIGVLGENPFGSVLNEIVKGENINGRKLVVEYSHSADDLKNCQIVFISQLEKEHISEILAKLNGQKILTVSDFVDFDRRGGIINFYLEDGKVHFEINPDAADHADLKISSQLLRLGKIVKTG